MGLRLYLQDSWDQDTDEEEQEPKSAAPPPPQPAKKNKKIGEKFEEREVSIV